MLNISHKIRSKLRDKHGVTEEELEQCFNNQVRTFIKDTREEHKTDPPTMWFIAETHKGRVLKVVFVFKDDQVYIKTAYPPNREEEAIYERRSKEI